MEQTKPTVTEAVDLLSRSKHKIVQMLLNQHRSQKIKVTKVQRQMAKQTARNEAVALDLDMSLADANCKKCYGRGFTGVDIVSDTPVYCKCVVRANERQLERGRSTEKLPKETSK